MSGKRGTLSDWKVAVEGTLDHLLDPYLENLNRVKRMLAIYRELVGNTGGEPLPTHTDLSRAAVVLMHAALEEFLRQLALAFLPTASPQVLDGIPFAGSAPGKRPEKILLGRLCQHRGKSVDDVITESIHEYLEHTNYSSVEEIVCLLEMVGLHVQESRAAFPRIASMIDRRHQIVHRADNTTRVEKERSANLASTR